jgi:2'-5' RNA ligase
MPRPNWFFAFPITGAFIATLPPPPAALRLFHPEDVHLTLSFLGSCGASAAEQALAALDQALAGLSASPLEVSLAEVVPMGRKSRYSALSALLDRGRAATSGLITSLRDVLSQAALGRSETRAPKPHVTLARPSRQASDAARAAGLIWAEQLDVRWVSARLDRVALYTWSEGNRRERLFRIVAERPLLRRD